MIKLFGLIPKRPDLSDEQFHAHWSTTHKELALRIAALRGYVQSHRIAVAVPGIPSAAYDGIAEVWLDDVATALGLADDPDYTENAKLDESNFIDVDRHGVIVAGERVLRSGPEVAQEAPGVKLMLLFRAGGVDPEALAARMGEARRVVLATPVDESYADGAGPPYDGVLEANFMDTAALERSWASAHDALADRSACCALVVDELRVIWPVGGRNGGWTSGSSAT